MEFEDVNERIEWEARRVAAAFGAITMSSITDSSFECECVQSEIEFSVKPDGLSAIFLGVEPDGDIGVYRDSSSSLVRWEAYNFHIMEGRPKIEMARGLYRLDFEDEDIFSQLPALSAHEKLELRLFLPREFWPQKWRDEEVK